MGAEAESGGRERDTNSWDALIERPVRQLAFESRLSTIAATITSEVQGRKSIHCSFATWEINQGCT